MKLLDAFKQQLDKLGDVRRVWLTTFNLNIGFVETYLLPAVLGMDQPRNRMDYESFQSYLVEKDIDFRIFCDKRMLGADQYKRTAIHVHSVSPRAFAQVDGVTDQTLFHPKVIYLENKSGQMVLGAGSANLTVGGWGRNQEVFTFRPVSNVEQYKQIKTFFDALGEPLGLTFDWPGRRFANNGSDWQFVHSFDRHTFLQRLMAQDRITSLQVWSPYLASDLPDLLARLREVSDNPKLKVALVADRLEGRYFRTPWGVNLAACIDNESLAFHDNPSSRHDLVEITHAKAWLVRSSKSCRLAIGSWNFTHSGTSSFEQRNIEAGIVLNCKRSADMLGKLINVTSTDFASDLLLQKDSLNLPEELPFDLNVHYDWQSACFTVAGQWCAEIPNNDYWLKLPGVKESMPLHWRARRQGGNFPLLPIELITPDNEAMLADHSYSILCRDQSPPVYRGLIIESGQSFRRAQGYDSLKDLLDSLVARINPQSDNNAVLRACLRTGTGPDEDLPVASASIEHDALSYFRLFQAIEHFRGRLLAVTDRVQLEKWLFSYPGCLQELAAKTRQQLQGKPTVFNWFLAQEVNSLYDLAVGSYRRYDRRKPAQALWSTLRVTLPKLPQGLAKRQDYLRCVEQECEYAP